MYGSSGEEDGESHRALLSPGLPPAGAKDDAGPYVPISQPRLSACDLFTTFPSLLKRELNPGHGFDPD